MQFYQTEQGRASRNIAMEKLIRRTLPKKPGERNQAVFRLVRGLKFMDPPPSLDERESIVKAWHAAALPVIRTKDFETTWDDFLIAWAKADVPLGSKGDVLNAAWLAALDMPTPKRTASRLPRYPIAHQLASLCRELQSLWEVRGHPDFFLAQDAVGKLLGVSQVAVSQNLARLEGIEQIKETVRYVPRKQAARYCFLDE